MNTKTIGLNMLDYNKNQPLGETYTCLQGEGKYMGIPHILIRVTGCRLRCQFSNSFCDEYKLEIKNKNSPTISL